MVMGSSVRSLLEVVMVGGLGWFDDDEGHLDSGSNGTRERRVVSMAAGEEELWLLIQVRIMFGEGGDVSLRSGKVKPPIASFSLLGYYGLLWMMRIVASEAVLGGDRC
ncbi:unnamed protein product [Dovyalis caffra]|uniref:Uncharacterized protein n=1 Tax=Dovyalis caffra TaxID=77055 RepID=A0AAV1SHZ0_9ROSI|nr:unnamed protein product [Dovyalis caffra]